MRTPDRFKAAVLLVLISCLGWAVPVAATCIPGQTRYIYVGDTASDAQCNFDAIQDAIDAVECPETWIVLSAEHTYTEQHLSVSNHSFTLVGGGDGAHCGGTPPVCDPTIGCGGGGLPALTTISGRNGNSVISFGGEANVFLYNLDITGGNAGSDGSGGGIYFGATGALTLNNTTIANNEAGYGGGIDMSPSGGSATLTLLQNTLVITNTADTSGGGIRIEGDTRLFALQSNTLIAFNQANGQSGDGFGGGLEVIGPAQADIGSPGYGAAGVISNNFAEYGGGAAAVANSSGNDVRLRLFSTDPMHPVAISDNGASHAGGGIFLKPYLPEGLGGGYTAGAELCAQDFQIDQNQAAEGAAIYGDEYEGDIGGFEGSTIALNTSPSGFPCDQPEPPTDLGAVACAGAVPCNRIDSNIAADESGVATDGSTVLIQTNGGAFLHRFSARANTGGHFINVVTGDETNGYYTYLNMQNGILAENLYTGALAISSEGHNNNVAIDSCTISSNTDGTDEYLMHFDGTVSLTNSIVDQVGSLTLDYQGGGTLTLADLLSNDLSTLTTGTQIAQGAPTFVDAADGDYHLTRDSKGVDFAPAQGGLDLDGHSRDVDLPDVPNQFGPRDLGAYEIQLGCSIDDTIFCDGFDG